MSGNEKKRRAAILTGCFWFFGLVTMLVIPLGNKSEGDYVVRGEIEQADHPSNVFEELMVPQYEGPEERQFIFEGICGEEITVNLEGIVNQEKRTIEDTSSVSNEIKGIAKLLGADGVRITRLNPKWVFKGADLTHQYAIVIGEQLPYRYTRPTPFPKQTANMVTQYYKSGGHVALFLAESIRKMGYPARAHYESWSQVVTIPVAVDAGMGELGRNGLLITPEFGPRGRISIVTTDLPLEPDEPRHLGIKEFCELCTKCVRYCPPNAVPLGGPSVVRGILSRSSEGSLNGRWIFRSALATGTRTPTITSTVWDASPPAHLINPIVFYIGWGSILFNAITSPGICSCTSMTSWVTDTSMMSKN